MSDNNSTEVLDLYFYSPSMAAAVVPSVIYFGLSLWHGYTNFIHTRRHRVSQKHKYTIPLFVACLISTLGWSVRIASVSDTSSIPLYAVSASYIVISPIFVCATLYILLTRLIAFSLPSDDRVFLGISSRWLGRVFITSDIFSFLTQCSGSGIASSGNWEGNMKDLGTNVLLVGLALQLATFSVYMTVLFMFQKRATILDESVRKVLIGVWTANVAVQTRSIYRVVEFGLGIDGYPFRNEWCLYVLEALPMLIALAALAWFHPIKLWQPRAGLEYGMEQVDKSRNKSDPQGAVLAA